MLRSILDQKMWLLEETSKIDLKITKALNRAKKAIINQQDYSEMIKKMNINAAGQEAIKADIIAESEFLKTLENENLNGVLYSEESGVKPFGKPNGEPENSIILLLDPLDGSQNYMKRIPIGCISVAYGPYADNPNLDNLNKALILNLYNDELFFGVKDRGAWFNGTKLHQQKNGHANLDDNFIQISYYAYGKKAREYFFDFQERYSLRSLGSAAWELALIADDRNDAYADIRGVLKAHDFAAAKIIIEASGGNFSFLNGERSSEINLNDFRKGYSVISSKKTNLLRLLEEDFKKHGLI